jgi:hypothetical protein
MNDISWWGAVLLSALVVVRAWQHLFRANRPRLKRRIYLAVFWFTMALGLPICTILGMRYRISLRDNTITQQAFGKRNVSISIRDVSSVGTEVSDAKTFVQMNRPMRRIVIASVRDGQATTIDVSMKHFLMADIRKLMRIIHSARPDLNVPTMWL